MMTPTNVAASRRTALQSIPLAIAAILAPPATAQDCPGQWLPQSPGFSNTVTSMVLAPNGDLIVGGYFTNIGGVPIKRIARWNGSTWSQIGAGLDGQVWSLTTLPNGHLVAGGTFYLNAGQVFNSVAEWDGSMWRPMGSGIQATVLALTVHNGEVIAGSDSTPYAVRRWNGSAWLPVGSTLFDGSVHCLTTLPGGDLVAGGTFTGVGTEPPNTIRRFDGTAWRAMQWGPGGYVLSLLLSSQGDLFAGGQFQAAGTSQARGVARRTGLDWTEVGGGVTAAPPPAYAAVRAMTLMPNGDLVVAGQFEAAGSTPARNIARWNGKSWSAFGSGLAGEPNYGTAYALQVMPDGDLVVGGYFNSAGGNPSPFFARWREAEPCYANCDCSALAPSINVADMICFMNKFSAGDPYANCDGSTTSPTLTVNDFVCFLIAYSGGCS